MSAGIVAIEILKGWAMTAGSGPALAAEAGSEHDRFTDFNRAMLQENIALCDTKAGLLLAFSGAMVIFCIDAIVNVHTSPPLKLQFLGLADKVVFLLAAGGFLASAQFSLTTVLPRIVRGREDHIFWESPVFKLPVDDYVAVIESLDPAVERVEQLRHLHLLAGICRSKFSHFKTALRLGQAAFLALVAGELTRVFI